MSTSPVIFIFAGGSGWWPFCAAIAIAGAAFILLSWVFQGLSDAVRYYTSGRWRDEGKREEERIEESVRWHRERSKKP